MNEEYLPRRYNTSTIVIESKAADAIDCRLVEVLQQRGSLFDVTGRPLYRKEQNINDINNARFCIGSLIKAMPLLVMSLRWRVGNVNFPEELQQGFPQLTCCNTKTDRYIDFIVLSEYDFALEKTQQIQKTKEAVFNSLPETLKQTYQW